MRQRALRLHRERAPQQQRSMAQRLLIRLMQARTGMQSTLPAAAVTQPCMRGMDRPPAQ